MAYQTGSATSASNLLDSIRSHLVANGWTINYWGADVVLGVATPVLADKLLCVTSPAGQFFQYMCYDTLGLVYTSAATGYTGGVSRNLQPGHSSNGLQTAGTKCDAGWAQTNLMIGPFAAHYFFSGASYMHVAVEVVTNRFMHFHVGTLEKAGTYVGGEYYTNTYWEDSNTNRNSPETSYHLFPFDGGGSNSVSDPSIRMDADGSTNNWVRVRAGNTSISGAIGMYRGSSLVKPMFDIGPNTFNGLSPLLPSIITGPRPLGGVSIYGTVKDVRPVNISQIEPKQLITIGADDWMVFPITRKGTGSIYEIVSGNYGIAYRKVP